jgi:hypothetical protein
MEVTLFGFELDIVARVPVADPPPRFIKRPRFVPIGPPPRSEWELPNGRVEAEVYEHHGAGIYRRVE